MVNGISKLVPFSDKNGVSLYMNGGYLILSTDFGLSIQWDGDTSVKVLLCKDYGNNVAGLCGNADGKTIVVQIVHKKALTLSYFYRKFH